MKALTITLLFFLTVYSFAEGTGDKKDTLWTPKGVVGVNLSQVAFTNWAQGGQNSLAFTFFSNFGIDYIGDPWKWRNNLSFAYGRTKLGKEGYRTNDNEIFFESTLIYNVGWAVSPYAGFTARSPVSKGFDYSIDPAEQIVNSFDPLYLTEGFGFIYDQIPNFSTRLGVGFKQTITDKFTSYSDDPMTSKIEKFKNETGIESVSEYKWLFMENTTYSTYLRLFGSFDDLAVWDVRWDNVITAKVNDYINVNFGVLVIYDVNETLKTQVKEALQLGISYTLF